MTATAATKSIISKKAETINALLALGVTLYASGPNTSEVQITQARTKTKGLAQQKGMQQLEVKEKGLTGWRAIWPSDSCYYYA